MWRFSEGNHHVLLVELASQEEVSIWIRKLETAGRINIWVFTEGINAAAKGRANKTDDST